ncbi:hypothetical protein KUTeg_010779 [Tegillarca granosa]|uniref:Uncharacterized protein n=1 Tax=Tegillarca granosa TaxID=220873 RepID=A0ABQ9F1Z9_TEGGR|nr:hypothetical protein KUTeg_010779 [Tegillarca granosa]
MGTEHAVEVYNTENKTSFDEPYNLTVSEINYAIFVKNIPGFLFFIIVSVIGTFGNANIIFCTGENLTNQITEQP